MESTLPPISSRSLLDFLTNLGSMTLIGAVKIDGGLAICSDGTMADIGSQGVYAHASHKMWKWGDRNIVFGYEGADTTGRPFLNSVQEQKEIATWGELAQWAAHELKTINDEQLALTGDDFICSSALFAGRLPDRRDGRERYDALTIGKNGAAHMMGERNSSAWIGLNEIPAKIAWDFLDEVYETHRLPSARNTEGVQHFIEMMLGVTPGLGEPIGLWEVLEDRPPKCLLPDYYAAAVN